MKTQTILPILLVGLLAATPARAQTSAAPAEEPWGSAKSGLQCQLSAATAFKVGEPCRFQVALRNVGSEAVSLGDTKKAFVWFMIALGSDRKAIFSEKVPAAAELKSNWLEGGKRLDLPPIQVNDLAAYDYQAGMKVLGGYVTGELPKSVASMGRAIPAGTIKARALVYLDRGDQPSVLLVSNTADVLVQPPALASLDGAERLAFVNQLLARFDKDAWAGMSAHRDAVALGPQIVPDLLEALAKPGRPAHSQMWLATAVCDIRDPKAAAGLVKLLAGPVCSVTHVIAYHGPKQQDAALDKAIVARVVEVGDARMTALAILGFLGARGSVPPEVLKIGLDSDDPRVRAQVISAFAQTADPAAVRRTADLLGDKNERVRITAARVLKGMKNNSPQVLARLVGALDMEGDQARAAVCDALSALSDKAMPYDAKAAPAQKAATVKAWKDWLAGQK
ncbi:MAG: hypothetical protein BWX88_02499 [Planctomycetes bacterium ADurb.Bin126]|nr:MAG: hypothetical protein BWX88_02499 [Planctomycetes bacterium ADurb.Bin126]HOD82162.1 HEAT repeat domain-containing protein [Phycisphaerae bacterium]HQL72615.1 HEAT repeat domain-containing protein [Phycisphaerae bacterium]